MPLSVKKNNYLDILQVFRGIAALMVVMHHSVVSLKYYHHINNDVLSFFGGLGKFGVDFFFVLSGFIIAYSASSKYGKKNAYKKYITSRLLRIYVPYLPIGIAVLLLYLAFPSFSNSERNISVFTSLTLIPHGSPALSVAWTLLFELMFYFLFSLSFVSKKTWNGFAISWALLILVCNYTFLHSILHQGNPILNVFLSLYNLEFLLGYVLAQVILKDWKVKYSNIIFPALLFSSLFLINFYFKSSWFHFSQNLLFSGLSFFWVWLCIQFHNTKINRNALFMLIGNSTYSIYLVHNPLQTMILRFFPEISSTISLTFAIGLVLMASCVIGYCYSAIFEKYAIKAIKAEIKKRKKEYGIWI